MPDITGIKRRMRGGRVVFDIMVDDEAAFSLSDLDLSVSGLRVGQQLTDEQVATFQEGAKSAKAYGLGLKYVGLRLRSEKELRDYLVRKGCDADEIASASSRLKELGLVSDLRFAQAWIADRQALKPRSRQRLAQELGAKGVDSDTVHQVLGDMDSDAELAALVALVLRKRKMSAYQEEQKLTAYLGRQGYRWADIKAALARVANE